MMEKTLCLALLAALTLTACQDEKSPSAKVTTQPVSTVQEPSQKMNSTVQQAAIPVKSAVAVTKSNGNDTGKSLQAAMHRTQAKVEGLKTDQPADHHVNVAKTVASARQIPDVITAKNAAVVSTNPAPKTAVTAKPEKKVAPKAAPATLPVPPVKTAPATTVATLPGKPVAIVGDAAKGKKIARKCQTCHNFTAKKKVGPGLKGVFGRKAGIMPDMKYGKSLAAGGWVWDEKHLDMWDCDSRKAIKVFSGDPSAKTKMPPQRICEPAKLANLIAFLKTL